MAPERANKRKLQAAATQERMLAAAREVFETSGYRGATVGAITRAADTAHGTFYLYFRNKDDAFDQVMAAMREEISEAQRARLVGDPHDDIEGVVRGFLDVFSEHAGLWRALLEGMMQSPAVERIWLDTRELFVERMAHGIEREQVAGRVRDLDPAMTALALGSMAEWCAFTYVVVGDNTGPAALDRAVRTLTDLWYHALYGNVAPSANGSDGRDSAS